MNVSFAVLSAMITPAVLISACGTLILSTSNRLGRVVDQVRALTERFKALMDNAEGGREEYAVQERQVVSWQVPRLTRRAQLLQRSLTAFYLAAGLFVLTSVVIGASAVSEGVSSASMVGRLLAGQLPVILSLAGAVALAYGSLLLIVEARLALATTARETRFLRQLIESYDAARPTGKRNDS